MSIVLTHQDAQLLDINKIIKKMFEKDRVFENFKKQTLIGILDGVDYCKAVLDPDSIIEFLSQVNDPFEIGRKLSQVCFVQNFIKFQAITSTIKRIEKMEDKIQLLYDKVFKYKTVSLVEFDLVAIMKSQNPIKFYFGTKEINLNQCISNFNSKTGKCDGKEFVRSLTRHILREIIPEEDLVKYSGSHRSHEFRPLPREFPAKVAELLASSLTHEITPQSLDIYREVVKDTSMRLFENARAAKKDKGEKEDLSATSSSSNTTNGTLKDNIPNIPLDSGERRNEISVENVQEVNEQERVMDKTPEERETTKDIEAAQLKKLVLKPERDQQQCEVNEQERVMDKTPEERETTKDIETAQPKKLVLKPERDQQQCESSTQHLEKRQYNFEGENEKEYAELYISRRRKPGNSSKVHDEEERNEITKNVNTAKYIKVNRKRKVSTNDGDCSDAYSPNFDQWDDASSNFGSPRSQCQSLPNEGTSRQSSNYDEIEDSSRANESSRENPLTKYSEYYHDGYQ